MSFRQKKNQNKLEPWFWSLKDQYIKDGEYPGPKDPLLLLQMQSFRWCQSSQNIFLLGKKQNVHQHRAIAKKAHIVSVCKARRIACRSDEISCQINSVLLWLQHSQHRVTRDWVSSLGTTLLQNRQMWGSEPTEGNNSPGPSDQEDWKSCSG